MARLTNQADVWHSDAGAPLNSFQWSHCHCPTQWPWFKCTVDSHHHKDEGLNKVSMLIVGAWLLTDYQC